MDENDFRPGPRLSGRQGPQSNTRRTHPGPDSLFPKEKRSTTLSRRAPFSTDVNLFVAFNDEILPLPVGRHGPLTAPERPVLRLLSSTPSRLEDTPVDLRVETLYRFLYENWTLLKFYLYFQHFLLSVQGTWDVSRKGLHL